jgi:hypothetical protein
MSLRRLWVLVSKLPQDSHTARVLHGEAADWTLDTALLARIGNFVLQTGSAKKVPESMLIHPPGSKGAPKAKTRANGHKTLGAAELDALFTGGG